MRLYFLNTWPVPKLVLLPLFIMAIGAAMLLAELCLEPSLPLKIGAVVTVIACAAFAGSLIIRA